MEFSRQQFSVLSKIFLALHNKTGNLFIEKYINVEC